MRAMRCEGSYEGRFSDMLLSSQSTTHRGGLSFFPSQEASVCAVLCSGGHK